MTASKPSPSALSKRSALVIGVGGLGCPALWALAGSGIGRVILCDDDEVSLSNLHRQLLFDDADIGQGKLAIAARKLRAMNPSLCVELEATRFLPENALQLASAADVIIEGSDNFATKFLAADAAALARRPVVHGAGVRWNATVFAVSEQGRPCYRCLFEDVPSASAGQSCDEAGVMGPVLGVAGALMADLALSLVSGDAERLGSIFTYDGRSDRLREVQVTARPECPLCGTSKTIGDIQEERYLAPSCAA